MTLTSNTIDEKARQLYGKSKEGTDDDTERGLSSAFPTKRTECNAIKGWFDHFRRRFNLKSGSLYGEAAFGDKPAVEETFKTIAEEVGYSWQQVFNMDEDLWRKRITSQL